MTIKITQMTDTRRYASSGVEPRIKFVDDDYRTVMHELACFCGRHFESMVRWWDHIGRWCVHRAVCTA